MFTGIVEECGVVVGLAELDQAARIQVRAGIVMEGTRPGDSIAVNGVCLTVVDVLADGFTADVMLQTLERTSLAAARPGAGVNLERAARLDSRIGGHLVQGHVDATGTVAAIVPSTHWTVMRIHMPASLSQFVAAKGSIAVDGVSLTVVDLWPGPAGSDQGSDQVAFEVSLIPTTLTHTILGRKEVGDPVNLEVDVIAKYVDRLLHADARWSRDAAQGLGGRP